MERKRNARLLWAQEISCFFQGMKFRRKERIIVWTQAQNWIEKSVLWLLKKERKYWSNKNDQPIIGRLKIQLFPRRGKPDLLRQTIWVGFTTQSQIGTLLRGAGKTAPPLQQIATNDCLTLKNGNWNFSNRCYSTKMLDGFWTKKCKTSTRSKMCGFTFQIWKATFSKLIESDVLQVHF